MDEFWSCDLQNWSDITILNYFFGHDHGLELCGWASNMAPTRVDKELPDRQKKMEKHGHQMNPPRSGPACIIKLFMNRGKVNITGQVLDSCHCHHQHQQWKACLDQTFWRKTFSKASKQRQVLQAEAFVLSLTNIFITLKKIAFLCGEETYSRLSGKK